MFENKECFANKGKICSALKIKECRNCKFCRNDLTTEEIERQILKYRFGKDK